MRRLARPLLYVGTVLIVVGLGRYHAQFIGHYYFHSAERLPWNLTYALLLSLAAYGVGLPDIRRGRSSLGPAVMAALVAAGAVSVLQLMFGSQLLPRFVLSAGGLAAVPWFVFCGWVADTGRSRDEMRDRVVAVIGVEERANMELEMSRDLERPAALVAILSPDQARPSGPQSRPLIETVLASLGTVVVLDRLASGDEAIVRQAATLHEAGMRVRTLSSFYDEWLGKLPVVELERMSLMFDVGELHRLRYGRLKRLADLGFALVGLLGMLLLLPLVIIGDLVANRGPIFYSQPRVGRGNKTFGILKFRTMRPNSGATEWTVEDDARITPFGRLLRRTHLDELPQVVNILRGDQSVVGPRPEQPEYVAELVDKLPFYGLRHLVRPGLTGWAQVKYDYGSTDLDALEKLQYEFYYLRHQSLVLDLRIVGRTLRHVVGLGGR